MEKKLENVLIRTFKKLRSCPDRTGKDAAGLFINYYYNEYQIHDGLDTRDFVVKIADDILTIYMPKKPSSYHKEAIQLHYELNKITPAEFYALWLRSRFEDPTTWAYPEVAQVLSVSDFIKNIENHYTKYISNTSK